MRIQILGSAAGGGFPQWNCGCGNCVAVRKNARENVRENKFSGKARTQAQLAVSADGSTWFLAGASPDLAFQIENSPTLHPRALHNTQRDSPIVGVVLGSCDLDHAVGLLLLRELQPLRVYAAPSILRDRKSTRLNSSHSQISYAVFCLKKKKKKSNIREARSKKTSTGCK